jgi:hypothetical protein
MSKYSLTINFETLDELVEFTTLYNKIYNKAEEKKTVKTISDKRGSKTVGLHLKAKDYRILHPELSYRQCLIYVSKPDPEPEQETKPELIEVDEIPEQEQKNTIEIYEQNITI